MYLKKIVNCSFFQAQRLHFLEQSRKFRNITLTFNALPRHVKVDIDNNGAPNGSVLCQPYNIQCPSASRFLSYFIHVLQSLPFPLFLFPRSFFSPLAAHSKFLCCTTSPWPPSIFLRIIKFQYNPKLTFQYIPSIPLII